MRWHLTECPLELALCPVKDVGCEKMVQRKELKLRLNEHLPQHLCLMCDAYIRPSLQLEGYKIELRTIQREQQTTNAELETSRDELKTELENKTFTLRANQHATTTAKLDDLRREMESLNRSIADVRRKMDSRNATEEHKEPLESQATWFL